MSEPIRIEGTWLPPKKGNVIVHILCRQADDRIAVVRYEKDLGPVLWHHGFIDIGTSPLQASAELGNLEVAMWSEPLKGPALPCPSCGLMPLDVEALRALVEEAKTSKRPLKFVV
jgi:hypothetical protein